MSLRSRTHLCTKTILKNQSPSKVQYPFIKVWTGSTDWFLDTLPPQVPHTHVLQEDRAGFLPGILPSDFCYVLPGESVKSNNIRLLVPTLCTQPHWGCTVLIFKGNSNSRHLSDTMKITNQGSSQFQP